MSDVRIRLEGAWESLEAATEVFERAAKSLSEGGTDELSRALSLSDSRRAEVERLSNESPEVRQLLERHHRARAAFFEQLKTRTMTLGFEDASTPAAVLFEGRSFNWPAWVLLSLGAVGLFVWSSNMWIAPVLISVVFALVFFDAPKLKVTTQSVAVGSQVFIRNELRAVREKRVASKRSVNHFLEFELLDGRTEMVRVTSLPSAFTESMKRLGLPVRT